MKAAVLRELHKPLSVEDIPSPYPGTPGDGVIRVKMLCAGICGAQLQEIDGKKGRPEWIPHLLGHEGCGRIVGDSVNFNDEDKVVIHWRKNRLPDSPVYLHPTINAGPVNCFSEYASISQDRLTVVPPWVPDDFACLLGCCLSTALATVENNIHWGERVLVLGCGGVGLSMIFAATRFNCSVHAIDKANKHLIAAVPFSTDIPKDNFDVIIDTTGNADVINIAMDHARGWRKLIMIGQGKGKLSVNGMFSGEGRTIMATQGGGFQPDRDIPRYVAMWKNGALNGYEYIITHRIKIEQINDGIALMREGKAGRVLIEF